MYNGMIIGFFEIKVKGCNKKFRKRPLMDAFWVFQLLCGVVGKKQGAES